MAAATVVPAMTIRGATLDVVTKVGISAMTSGQLEVIAHGGPHGVAPSMVVYQSTVDPTSGPVTLEWQKASNDLTNDTATVRLSVPAGGDIANAVGELLFYFASCKSGGLITA